MRYQDSDPVDKEFTWTVHPVRERIWAAMGATLVILVVIFVIYVSFQNVFWSLFGAGAMLLSLNRFYFPSHFVMDDEGIGARYLFSNQRFRWRNVRRFMSDEYGGYLSARKEPSRLDSFRGMNILFGRHREIVVERIQKQLRRYRSP